MGQRPQWAMPSSIHRSAFVMHHSRHDQSDSDRRRDADGARGRRSRRRRVAPENTLPAFEAAVRLGVNMVELDYLHTADGVPVAFHDEELDRLTDARARWGGEKIPLASKTLTELETLDAGSWFSPAFAGTRIPTLEAAIDTILTGSLALIERKAGDAATLVELANRKRCVGRIAVMAFDWDFLRECRQLSQTLVLGGARRARRQVAATGRDAILSRRVCRLEQQTSDQAAYRRHARARLAGLGLDRGRSAAGRRADRLRRRHDHEQCAGCDPESCRGHAEGVIGVAAPGASWPCRCQRREHRGRHRP